MINRICNTDDLLPPQNVAAEELLLGSILLEPDNFAQVSSNLPIEAFYITAHQKIYKIILNLYLEGKNPDLTTVAAVLHDLNLLEEIGGLNKLKKMVEQTISTYNIEQYAALIKEKYLRRCLIDSGREITSLGFDFNSRIEHLFFKAEQSLFKVIQKKVSNDLLPVSDILLDTFLDLENRLNNNKLNGLSSGFEDLDSMTQGFQKSDLIIIAGRPSMGKTAFALNIGFNVCNKENIPVAIFSLEMSKQQILYRILSYKTSISLTKLRSGRLSSDEWKVINHALKELYNLELYIDDTNYCSINEIRSKIKRLFSKKNNLGLIIIDYLQLMESHNKFNNRVQELSQITRSLKNLAKEFNTPILVLSQLSRAVESRLNKRPLLSDLRESGCIEQNTILINSKLDKTLIVDSLYKNKITNYQIYVLNNKKKIITTYSINNINFTGSKYTYQILCEGGLYIRLTSNHKILTNNGWKRTDTITPKDKIYYICHSNLYDISTQSILKLISVISIIYYSKQNVYDLEIIEYKNFIANYFIVHNSIEQDADLVLMLYRQDYYNSNGIDDNICEIIITKQRNGPIGTIKLKFDATTTQFSTFTLPYAKDKVN
ncbi:replication helicase subunit (chloroplast) [Galdieria partita]|uniref:Replicative DNA helicase n=1 Tax=Galdieria partita TaxID=83374 RepID=A0A9C7C8Z5_9RHOD|nr:replication helicase subunit [Galdieria partita]